jgi:hypothetical protein
MRAGTDLAKPHDLRRRRFIAGVGAPSRSLRLGEEALGRPIHDNW